MMKRLSGLVAATFTPFRSDDSLDLDKVPMLVDFAVRQKLAGLFAVGSTGEFTALTLEERRLTAEAYLKAAAGRIPIIVNVGSCSVRESIQLAEHAVAHGADALCTIAPFYQKPASVRALAEVLKAIAAACDGRPLFLYHIPVLTGLRLSMRELLEIAAAEIPNFAGLKYTDENLFEYCTCLDYSDRFQILYGRDEMLLGALAMGAEAAVGSTYNYLPRLYHEMIAAFRGGDHRRAHELQALTHASVRLLGKYGPQSSKLFMKAAGLEIGFARLPALRLPREQGNAFYRDVEAAGLLPWLG